MEITNQAESGNDISADAYVVTATIPNQEVSDNPVEIPRDFQFWEWAPVSFGPENLLWTYLWPTRKATNSWEYWSEKYLAWCSWLISNEISSSLDSDTSCDTSFN